MRLPFKAFATQTFMRPFTKHRFASCAGCAALLRDFALGLAGPRSPDAARFGELAGEQRSVSDGAVPTGNLIFILKHTRRAELV